ncbi:focadhesin family member [Anaeramoeba ignava]|uniref:Focadhesin family member n=1 Tax=Anaeramoeba ignava TaxID=1746090 RepID=A0A9Q0LTZ8_ANAIG|nr:focadhesin family member [Anaeramoeba ignava]
MFSSFELFNIFKKITNYKKEEKKTITNQINFLKQTLTEKNQTNSELAIEYLSTLAIEYPKIYSSSNFFQDFTDSITILSHGSISLAIEKLIFSFQHKKYSQDFKSYFPFIQIFNKRPECFTLIVDNFYQFWIQNQNQNFFFQFFKQNSQLFAHIFSRINLNQIQNQAVKYLQSKINTFLGKSLNEENHKLFASFLIYSSKFKLLKESEKNQFAKKRMKKYDNSNINIEFVELIDNILLLENLQTRIQTRIFILEMCIYIDINIPNPDQFSISILQLLKNYPQEILSKPSKATLYQINSYILLLSALIFMSKSLQEKHILVSLLQNFLCEISPEKISKTILFVALMPVIDFSFHSPSNLKSQQLTNKCLLRIQELIHSKEQFQKPHHQFVTKLLLDNIHLNYLAQKIGLYEIYQLYNFFHIIEKAFSGDENVLFPLQKMLRKMEMEKYSSNLSNFGFCCVSLCISSLTFHPDQNIRGFAFDTIQNILVYLGEKTEFLFPLLLHHLQREEEPKLTNLIMNLLPSFASHKNYTLQVVRSVDTFFTSKNISLKSSALILASKIFERNNRTFSKLEVMIRKIADLQNDFVDQQQSLELKIGVIQAIKMVMIYEEKNPSVSALGIECVQILCEKEELDFILVWSVLSRKLFKTEENLINITKLTELDGLILEKLASLWGCGAEVKVEIPDESRQIEASEKYIIVKNILDLLWECIKNDYPLYIRESSCKSLETFLLVNEKMFFHSLLDFEDFDEKITLLFEGVYNSKTENFSSLCANLINHEYKVTRGYRNQEDTSRSQESLTKAMKILKEISSLVYQKYLDSNNTICQGIIFIDPILLLRRENNPSMDFSLSDLTNDLVCNDWILQFFGFFGWPLFMKRYTDSQIENNTQKSGFDLKDNLEAIESIFEELKQTEKTQKNNSKSVNSMMAISSLSYSFFSSLNSGFLNMEYNAKLDDIYHFMMDVFQNQETDGSLKESVLLGLSYLACVFWHNSSQEFNKILELIIEQQQQQSNNNNSKVNYHQPFGNWKGFALGLIAWEFQKKMEQSKFERRTSNVDQEYLQEITLFMKVFNMLKSYSFSQSQFQSNFSEISFFIGLSWTVKSLEKIHRIDEIFGLYNEMKRNILKHIEKPSDHYQNFTPKLIGSLFCIPEFLESCLNFSQISTQEAVEMYEKIYTIANQGNESLIRIDQQITSMACISVGKLAHILYGISNKEGFKIEANSLTKTILMLTKFSRNSDSPQIRVGSLIGLANVFIDMKPSLFSQTMQFSFRLGNESQIFHFMQFIELLKELLITGKEKATSVKLILSFLLGLFEFNNIKNDLLETKASNSLSHISRSLIMRRAFDFMQENEANQENEPEFNQNSMIKCFTQVENIPAINWALILENIMKKYPQSSWKNLFKFALKHEQPSFLLFFLKSKQSFSELNLNLKLFLFKNLAQILSLVPISHFVGIMEETIVYFSHQEELKEAIIGSIGKFLQSKKLPNYQVLTAFEDFLVDFYSEMEVDQKDEKFIKLLKKLSFAISKLPENSVKKIIFSIENLPKKSNEKILLLKTNLIYWDSLPISSLNEVRNHLIQNSEQFHFSIYKKITISIANSIRNPTNIKNPAILEQIEMRFFNESLSYLHFCEDLTEGVLFINCLCFSFLQSGNVAMRILFQNMEKMDAILMFSFSISRFISSFYFEMENIEMKEILENFLSCLGNEKFVLVHQEIYELIRDLWLKYPNLFSNENNISKINEQMMKKEIDKI